MTDDPAAHKPIQVAEEGVQDVPGKYSRGWQKIDGEWRIQLQNCSPDS